MMSPHLVPIFASLLHWFVFLQVVLFSFCVYNKIGVQLSYKAQCTKNKKKMQIIKDSHVSTLFAIFYISNTLCMDCDISFWMTSKLFLDFSVLQTKKRSTILRVFYLNCFLALYSSSSITKIFVYFLWHFLKK